MNHSQFPKSASTSKFNVRPPNRRRPSRIPVLIKRKHPNAVNVQIGTFSTQKQPAKSTNHGRPNRLDPTTLSHSKHNGVQKNSSLTGTTTSRNGKFATISPKQLNKNKGASPHARLHEDTKPSNGTTHKRKQFSCKKPSTPESVNSGLTTPNLISRSPINTDSELEKTIRRDPEGSPPDRDVRPSTLNHLSLKSNSFPRFGSRSDENESHKKPTVSRSQSTPAEGKQICSRKVDLPVKENEFTLQEWNCRSQRMQNLLLHVHVRFDSGNLPDLEQPKTIIDEHFNLEWLHNALDFAHIKFCEQCATVTLTYYI